MGYMVPSHPSLRNGTIIRSLASTQYLRAIFDSFISIVPASNQTANSDSQLSSKISVESYEVANDIASLTYKRQLRTTQRN